MQTIITVKCMDQALQLTNAPRIASGGVNVVRAEFEFCPLWDDLAKTAVFYNDPKEVYHAVLADDACIVPQEVLAAPGLMYMGVFGVDADGNVVRPSVTLVLTIEEGAITEATAVSDPTPELYEQVLAEVQKAREAVEAATPVDVDLTGAPLEYVAVMEDEDGDPIPADAITYGEQALTEEQKAQARKNIGAAAVGELGGSGVHIGTEPPTDPNVTVWVDTDEEPEAGGGAGGAAIDVTAEVGQTIVVEEVDENGKPVKWKAADYQPRTHYKTWKTLVEEQEFDVSGNTLDGQYIRIEIPTAIDTDIRKYKINLNGVDYICEAALTALDFGCASFTIERGDGASKFPFSSIIYVSWETDEPYTDFIILLFDGDYPTVRLSIAQEVYEKIPATYLKNKVIMLNDEIDEVYEGAVEVYSCTNDFFIDDLFDGGQVTIGKRTEDGLHFFKVTSWTTEASDPMFNVYLSVYDPEHILMDSDDPNVKIWVSGFTIPQKYTELMS